MSVAVITHWPALQTGTETGPGTALLAAVALALVHVVGEPYYAKRLDNWSPERRRGVRSAAGGAAIAYVFVVLLPEVSETALLTEDLRLPPLIAEEAVYVLALGGLVVFYAVEAVAVHSTDESVETSPTVFWAHLATFAAYSVLIGYLLQYQDEAGLMELLLYALAMALHFLGTDDGLRRHHGATYDRIGRWLLGGATLLGGAFGVFATARGLLAPLLLGFLAGGVVLNVVKEELPSAEQSRVTAFVAGALAYTLLVLGT